MELGVHLPLIDFDGEGISRRRLVETVEAARAHGFAAVSANDHLVFARPWIDGLASLALAIEHSGEMALATTTTLSVVRGPVATAKAIAALDILSGGRLEPSLGPGSSARDYEAVGIPFKERWPRYDESLRIVRAALDGEAVRGTLRFYEPPPRLEPAPARRVPIWVASWGSEAGLRRVARLGDGWLASAYNITPAAFADARSRLDSMLAAGGRDPARFPTALATIWTRVTDSDAEAERTLEELLSPLLGRSVDELRERVGVATPDRLAERLVEYARAGCGRVYLWPLGDETAQLERIATEVMPALAAAV